MTPRERLLAVVVGTAIALGLGYKGVDVLFVQQHREAKATLERLDADEDRLEGLIRSRERLAATWSRQVRRTFSFEKAEAQGRFGEALKKLAKRHGFDDASFSTGSGGKIGRKTGISTVAHRITLEGKFADVMAFLRDIYKTPYLCQIKKLTLAPLGRGGPRGAVKLEFTVESPLLPKIDPKKVPFVRNETLPREQEGPVTPVREHLRGEDHFRILASRNILCPYLPPPMNVVLIDNKDRKTVALKIRFFWEEQFSEQLVETVAGKSALPVKGKGDVVELRGTYADGETFGPKRFEFDGKKDWTYVVASHTPAPPPTVVDLAVNNRHNEAVYLEVAVTTQDNKVRNEPVMWFKSGVSDVREYQDVKSVKVTAKYASGKKHLLKVFLPGEGKQTYEVPPEPAEQVVAVAEGETPPASDPPADQRFVVTGLVSYVEDGQWVQEMIATGGTERKIIRAGEEGAVDGGTLLAIVPSLGGIVKMPATGNYYVYPFQGKFAHRVLLEAREDADLPAAIDAWTRR